MTSVHTIPSGHAGSGRDGRRGDRQRPAGSGTGEGLSACSAGRAGRLDGRPDWCAHQIEMVPDVNGVAGCGPGHDCVEYENALRAQRDCPPLLIERK